MTVGQILFPGLRKLGNEKNNSCLNAYNILAFQTTFKFLEFQCSMFESYEIAHYFHSPGERKSTELCGLRNYDPAIPTHLLIGPMNYLTDFMLPILANKKGRRVTTL